MKTISLMLKGLVLGIVLLIPGASASTIAILMGIYEKIIYSISDIFTNFKKSFMYLFQVGIGIFIGAILASIIITRLLDKSSYIIYSIFLGISIGCIPSAYEDRKISFKGIKEVIWIIISFALSLTFSIIKTNNDAVVEINIYTCIMLFASGFVGAIGCIIPGISGMVLIMILGYYPLILNSINEIVLLQNIWTNIIVLLIFASGMAIGILLISKVIYKLINKFPIEVNHCVFGFVIGSIYYIFIKIFEQNIYFTKMIIVVITTIISTCIVYLFTKMSKKNNI